MKFFKFSIIFLLIFGIACGFNQVRSFNEDKICMCESDQYTELDEIEKKESCLDFEKSFWLQRSQTESPFHDYVNGISLAISAVASLILSKNLSKLITHSPPLSSSSAVQ